LVTKIEPKPIKIEIKIKEIKIFLLIF